MDVSRKLFSSLRFRGALVVMLVIGLLFTVLLANTERVLRAVARENMQTTIRQTSETLNLAISPSTGDVSRAALSDYFREIVAGADSGIVYLLLTDEGGRRLVVTENVPVRLPDPAVDLGIQMRRGVVHVEQPILLEGNHVGSLRYGLSSSHYLAASESILAQNASVVVVSLLLAGLLLTLLGFWINRRLSRLMQASQTLASGDYSARAPETGGDEISQLASNFNVMAAAVAGRITELEMSRAHIVELNASLEARVLERTAELTERNKELSQAITNLRHTQESLVRSEKLASLGSMVAAIAHEMNTPIGNALTVATALASKSAAFGREVEQGLRKAVLERYRQDSQDASALIERNLERASALITSFKHVAIDQTSSHRRSFDLGETLAEVAYTIRPSFAPSGHALVTNLPAGLAMDSFPGPLGQVITNLVTNAVLHGFEGRAGGSMKLECRALHDRHVEVTFSDDGNGISQENLARIFDPFFTTRLGSGGSGLGLNIVYNIVAGLLGGEIEVHSEPGAGTRFRIVIPRKAPVEAAGVAA